MSENRALLGPSPKLKGHFSPVMGGWLIPESRNAPDLVRNRNTEIEIMWPPSEEVLNGANMERASYLRAVSPPGTPSLPLKYLVFISQRTSHCK